jgi:Tol biopolymer transport system component
LFLIDPAGGQPRQLTRAEFGVFDYQVAPDGARIAYSAMREDGGSDLVSMALDGTAESSLLTCPEAVCSGPSWAADGRRLIYERRTLLVAGAAPGPPRLWWLDTASGETVQLFGDSQMLGYGATWSPAGDWLSYVAPSSQGVQVYNIDDGRSLIVPSRMGGLAAWSPAQDTFVVADIQRSDQGFAIHLLKASPDGGELIDISGADEAVEDSSPAWSPTGEWIAFTRKVASAAMGKQLWLMRPDGSEQHFLTNDSDLHHANPRWSPDGATIAYQRFPLKEINAGTSIWLMDVERGESRELVPRGSRPTWVP